MTYYKMDNTQPKERESDSRIRELRDMYDGDPRYTKYFWLTSDECYSMCVPTDDNNMDNMPSVFRHVDTIKDVRSATNGFVDKEKQYICCFTGLKCHHSQTVCTKCKIPEYYPTKAKRLLKQAETRYGQQEEY